jgi:non-canonical (house-cleaning) NTP pyrophosphatase
MKVLRASFEADETTIVTSAEFDALDLLSQLDILKDLIYDLRTIYSDKLKEHRAAMPSKQKAISARARERAMEAFGYRQGGWTYKTIGIEMGVSANRARQLVQKAERMVEREKRWDKK